MTEKGKIAEMAEKISLLKKTATELKQLSEGNQAIERNIERILASIKMLEINVTDVASIL